MFVEEGKGGGIGKSWRRVEGDAAGRAGLEFSSLLPSFLLFLIVFHL